jgi:thiosulfate/3-mercaptopyruvate sulfurtransferase
MLTKPQIETLLSNAGVANTDTLILYGGLNNLVAAFVFWTLKLYGHTNVRLLDGGRQKWVAEGRALTTATPVMQSTAYVAQEPNWNLRADHELIAKAIGHPGYILVDARSATMYLGEDTSGTERGGHIPSAINVPAHLVVDAEGTFQGWQTPTTFDDGTFRPVEELRALFAEHGISADKTVITYCVRGGLSSHLWFVLTQLLGYPNVREYDRSWIEWGNLKDAPVER